ncbi:MAG: radical SAM protein [Candidatus Brocadiia bacterium]
MKLGLIAMSGVRVIHPELAWLGVSLPQFVSRGHVIASLPSLTLLILASLTPKEIDVEYFDVPHIKDLKFSKLPDFDIVAIASYSAQIYEAYTLADEYRRRGATVVLGGPHVSALPAEAAQHADSIVIGEAEPLWPTLMDDWLHGAIKPCYREERPGTYDLALSPVPRFDLLDPANYNRIPIVTSRGCPHDCEFCAGSKNYGKGYRQKPVANVMRDVRAVSDIWDRPFVEFADDNTFVDKAWSRELVDAIAPLGVRWFAETDISIVEDTELLSRLRPAGCHQLLIGFESLNESRLRGLDSTGWKASKLAHYAEAVNEIQSHGVTVNACFIIGLDGDGPEVFDSVRQFVRVADPLEVQVTVLTPFPGTRLFHRLEAEGRLDPQPFWHKLTLFDLNYEPRGMTRLQLENGLMSLFRDLYDEESYSRRKRKYMEIIRGLRRRNSA